MEVVHNVELSIVMPCLNEAETLAACITKAQSWLAAQNVKGEVVIADNGSSDGSQEIARCLGASVIEVPEKGYGSALFAGSSAANGKYIIMGDSDDSYDFSKLDFFVEALRAGADFVIGDRFAGGIEKGAMPWKNKYIGNPALSFIGRTLFRTQIRDFHCGLRGYSKEAFERMNLITSGMEFASEMVIKARLLGMTVREVPTTLSRDGRSRPPHLKPWRDGWRHLRFMLTYSPRWVFIIPGSVLAAVSTIVYVPLLFGPVYFGLIGIDINSLFYAQSGVTLGVLSFLIGVVFRTFASREGLLPNNRMLERLRALPVLEIGNIIGFVLLLAGIFIGIVSFNQWANTGFGHVEPEDTLRLISLSTLFLVLGGAISLISLVFGILSMPINRFRTPSA
jgi:glycosyltransferase involved in cell wall biosynthesis